MQKSLPLRVAESLDQSHCGIISSAKFVPSCDSETIHYTIYANQDCQLELWGVSNHQQLVEDAFGKKIKYQVNSPG